MTLAYLHETFGEEINDAEEETFLLYAQPIPSSNLGFIDPKASSVDVDVAGKNYTIYQSPGVLASDRAGGTTGAVLWKITPSFANWLSSPTNFLFSSHLLSHTSTILELGCGISPLNALATSPRIARHILTDQHYVQKLMDVNISENMPHSSTLRTTNQNRSSKGKKQGKNNNNISFTTLDWETDTPTAALIPNNNNGDAAATTKTSSFDAVLACDCVYNYALIPPLVSTCAAACKLREDDDNDKAGEENGKKQTLCIVAQQLRNDDVFCSWLREFMTLFRVWRVKDDLLPAELRPGAGFVVHVGVLRESS